MNSISNISDDKLAFESLIKDSFVEEYEYSKTCLRDMWKIADELNPTIAIDRNLLFCSAWLHDIAKENNNKKHNEYAQEIIVKNFICNSCEENRLLNKYCSIILCHKGNFTPDNNMFRKSAILRISDKIDK